MAYEAARNGTNPVFCHNYSKTVRRAMKEIKASEGSYQLLGSGKTVTLVDP